MSTKITINNCLLTTRVDELAVSEPDAEYAEYPISPSTYAEGFKVVTFSQLSNAINGAAYWLEENIGKGNNFETLTHTGPNDLRYLILILDALKAGYKRSSLTAKKKDSQNTGNIINISFRCY